MTEPAELRPLRPALCGAAGFVGLSYVALWFQMRLLLPLTVVALAGLATGSGGSGGVGSGSSGRRSSRLVSGYGGGQSSGYGGNGES